MTKAQLTILIIWLCFTVFAFGYFTMEKLVSFDPNNKLAGIEYKKLASYLSPYLNRGLGQNSHTVLHFSKLNCDCQQYSEQHIKDLNKIASENQFQIQNITLDKDEILPATPSVAIIDNLGELIYFGPYGQGLACSQTSGYAQTMLKNYLKGYTANIVIKQAEGCYCAI